MHIPTHYVFLFIAILLGESAVLFVYTVIGLIKSNPLPYMIPPMVSAPEQLPVCAFYGHPEVAATQISTITTTVYETRIPTVVELNGLQSDISAILQPVLTSETAMALTTTTIESDNSTPASTTQSLKTVTVVVFSTSTIPASSTALPVRSTVYVTTMVFASAPA